MNGNEIIIGSTVPDNEQMVITRYVLPIP